MLKQVRRLCFKCLITYSSSEALFKPCCDVSICRSSVRLLNGQRQKSLWFLCGRKYVSVFASTFRIPSFCSEVLQQFIVNLFGYQKPAKAPCFEHSRSGADNVHVSGYLFTATNKGPTKVCVGRFPQSLHNTTAPNLQSAEV